ncbi:methyltransferase domain-containing protein [Candidatus Woesearchaeota archaeon]|nr:methyltransferase domain-containing protein [Candidatus Woesearchaeota archaeon]
MLTHIPYGYERLFELITEQSSTHQIRTILEIGSGSGNFVGLLRKQGFDAEGIEGKVESYRDDLGQWLHRGDVVQLAEIFGDKFFDMIIAQGVFCHSAQFDYVFSSYLPPEMIIPAFIDPKLREELKIPIRLKIEKMLRSCFNQLNPNGLLVDVENYVPGDCVFFTKESAERIVYRVLRYEPKEAVLQKPY